MTYSLQLPEVSSFQEVTEELRQIERALQVPRSDSITLTVHHTAPLKYEQGMVVYADGTDWNPGSGGGLYLRTAASWVKL